MSEKGQLFHGDYYPDNFVINPDYQQAEPNVGECIGYTIREYLGVTFHGFLYWLADSDGKRSIHVLGKRRE